MPGKSFAEKMVCDRLVMLRILVALSLVIAAAIIGYGSFYFLHNFQSSLESDQYYALVKKIQAATVNSLTEKDDALVHVAATARFLYPNASMWPLTAIPFDYFQNIGDPLIRMASMRSVALAPIITPSQVPVFEAYADSFLEESGYRSTYPNMGVSSFGNGIYAINHTTGQRYHTTTASTLCTRDVLLPVIEMGDLPNNYPAVMYDLYSEKLRCSAADHSLQCAEDATDYGQNCSSTTSVLFLSQDLPTQRPASLTTHPIKLNSGAIVGIVYTEHNWDVVLSSAINTQVSGIKMVLSYGTKTQYTFTVSSGVVKYVHSGDAHDSKYDSRRFSFLATAYGGPEKFVVHLYPSDEWVRLYENDLPAIICGVTVGILALTSLVFFFYDYLINRAAFEKDLILKTKRQFVRYISHEIRTPLNIVQLGFKLLYSEMFTFNASIQTDPTMPPAVLEAFKDWLGLVTDVADSADVAISVLNDLINYDKLHMGTLQLEIEPLFIWDIIAPAVHPFVIQARHAGVKLITDYEDHRDTASATEKSLMRNQVVFGDSGKLSQVIRNLVSNALKFTPSGGEVVITAVWKRDGMPGVVAAMDGEHCPDVDLSAYERCGSIVITVKDSGAGMSAENLKALFKEGVQFHANQLQAGQGSGLGLWIAKGIVLMHHGTLVATSEGEQMGSTFTLELPLTVNKNNSDDDVDLEKQDARDLQHPETMTRSSDIDSLKSDRFADSASRLRNILITDDSALNRKMLCRLLRAAGYTCFEAGDGQECVDKVIQSMGGEHPPIEVILMDYEMPRMNGPTAASVLRSLGYSVPVIGITGNVLNEDKEFFMSKGANKVLNKPLTLSQLSDSLYELHQRKLAARGEATDPAAVAVQLPLTEMQEVTEVKEGTEEV